MKPEKEGMMDSAVNGFESCWRELKPGLERNLRSRGATPDEVEDVLQETSIRLLRAWSRLDHARPLGPLARKIARNLLVDLRRSRRVIPMDELPDEPATYDLEEHALARLRLGRARIGLAALQPSDRAVLLAEVGVGRHENTSALKMARLRARARLSATLDKVAAAFGIVNLASRRLTSWVHHSTQLSPEPFLPAVAGMMTIVSLAVAPGISDRATPKQTRAHVVAQVDDVVAKRSGDPVRSKVTKPSRIARAEEPAGDAYVAASEEPSRSRPSEETLVDAGNAHAKSREGQGYRSVEVCAGDETSDETDDQGTSVTIFDGSQNGGPPEACS